MKLLDSPALLTDLYQLTMMQTYLEYGLTDTAVFEFFSRRLPEGRNFLLACGLETVLDFLENLRFTDEEIAWIRKSGRFSADFADYLAGVRFTGHVHALPEGTPFFADEPILRVTATLPIAQLVETRIINLLHFQTLVASKAVRAVFAVPGKRLVDFGLRRAHGAEAGLLAARAAWIAGFAGTSNVLAGRYWDIPIFGTMAHAFVEAHDDEDTAFMHFASSHPQNAVLLIDTYDTEAAAARLGRLAAAGLPIHGVRIDSGDLSEHARRVRALLDGHGLRGVTIFASGDLDEYALERLADAPIDGFGIGTRLTTSADVPYLNCAYKLEEYAGRPRRKRSEGKATWPGRKQIYRLERDGRFAGDLIAGEDETASGTPLLVEVMHGGRRLVPSPRLTAVRAHAASQLAHLPDGLRKLTTATSPYPVRVSAKLQSLARELDADAAP